MSYEPTRHAETRGAIALSGSVDDSALRGLSMGDALNIDNLLTLWLNAIPAHKIAGARWYSDAHRFADSLSFWSNKPLDVVCAAISALSPQLAWEDNLDCAERLIVKQEDLWGSKAVGPMIVKAKRILSGELKPRDAFNMKTSPKTFCFYRNILAPEKTTYVTIDRHAAAAYLGQAFGPARINQPLYWRIHDAFLKAARIAGVNPNQFQATIWLTIREGNQYTLL